jgi:phosphoribosylformylglycinamidine cyclo-ligase
MLSPRPQTSSITSRQTAGSYRAATTTCGCIAPIGGLLAACIYRRFSRSAGISADPRSGRPALLDGQCATAHPAFRSLAAYGKNSATEADMTDKLQPGADRRNARQSYRDSGVDIDAGNALVEAIKPLARATARRGADAGLGGFGALFDLKAAGFRDPILVSTTDGVGTKLKIAIAAGRHETIGIDLVAMCVDDLVCQGAEPLFFLDYIAVGKLDPGHIKQLVKGVAEGCRTAGCALVGGEMAEHPGAMEPGEFDLVGFAVGVVERDRLITGEHVRPGDVLVGLRSPGLRSNGYSLARRVLLDGGGRALHEPAFEGAHHDLAEELLRPSVIYAPALLALQRAVDVRAAAHITGGGIPGNLARILPATSDAVVDRDTWEPPRIFDEIQRLGDIDDDEMARVFNLGIGMIVVVSADDLHRTIDLLQAKGHAPRAIGSIEEGDGDVRLVGR